MGSTPDPNIAVLYYDAPFLREVEVKYAAEKTCIDAYGAGKIFPSMMCASDTDGTNPIQGSCNGDSGGPLFDANFKVLVGINSWGNNGRGGLCEAANFPGVYARIANQWPWIQTTICADHSLPKPEFCPQTKPARPSMKPKKPANKKKGGKGGNKGGNGGKGGKTGKGGKFFSYFFFHFEPFQHQEIISLSSVYI